MNYTCRAEKALNGFLITNCYSLCEKIGHKRLAKSNLSKTKIITENPNFPIHSFSIFGCISVFGFLLTAHIHLILVPFVAL